MKKQSLKKQSTSFQIEGKSSTSLKKQSIIDLADDIAHRDDSRDIAKDIKFFINKLNIATAQYEKYGRPGILSIIHKHQERIAMLTRAIIDRK